MVRPDELVEGTLYTLQQSDKLPDGTSFIDHEPDINSESIKLPLVEVSMGSMLDISDVNTDLVGYSTDDDGNQIGRIYQSLYTQELQVSVWTAHGSKYDVGELSNVVRQELYKHTTAGPDIPIRHPSDDRQLDEVWRFWLTEASRTDDLATSPSLRRWQEIIQISASEQFEAIPSEDPIEKVTERALIGEVKNNELVQ